MGEQQITDMQENHGHRCPANRIAESAFGCEKELGHKGPHKNHLGETQPQSEKIRIQRDKSGFGFYLYSYTNRYHRYRKRVLVCGYCGNAEHYHPKPGRKSSARGRLWKRCSHIVDIGGVRRHKPIEKQVLDEILGPRAYDYVD